MEAPAVHIVSDSSDEEGVTSTRSQAHGSASSESDESTVACAQDDETYAETRRDFLHGTADSLIVPRVREVRQLKGVVDNLATQIAKLSALRDAIEQATILHASLDQMLEGDLRRANAVVETYSISLEEQLHPKYSANLASVVDMFMIDV